MKKIDLYQIAIKLAGLYLVLVLLGQLRELLFFLSLLRQSKNDPTSFSGGNPTVLFLVSLVCILILVAISALLIFKTKAVSKVICSKEDADDSLSFSLNKQSIYEVAILTAGLITVMMAIPDFLIQVKNYTNDFKNLPGNSYQLDSVIVGGLQVLLGLGLVLFARPLASYFSKVPKLPPH